MDAALSEMLNWYLAGLFMAWNTHQVHKQDLSGHIHHWNLEEIAQAFCRIKSKVLEILMENKLRGHKSKSHNITSNNSEFKPESWNVLFVWRLFYAGNTVICQWDYLLYYVIKNSLRKTDMF